MGSSTGPRLNKDYGGFDRARSLFSNLPAAVDHLCDYQIFFDDFLASVNDATNQWIVVKDTGATALVGTGDVENGALTLTSTATTDDDGGSIQRAETTFLVKSGKKLWFEARVKVSDADQGEMFVGLADNFATDPEAVIVEGVARVGFELIDGAATINTVIDNDTAATKTVLSSSMSDDTYVRLGFRTDGASIRFYVNRALVSTQSIPAAIAAVTLGPAFFHLSGNASGTHTAAIDYILAAQVRD
jgi:hypothetical protein